MSLYPLIKDQKIIIDDHKRGAGEIKDWDNNENDVHLDKTLKRKVHGKLQTLRIKIPLNSERRILVKSKSKKYSEVPKSIKKEIAKAFEDSEIRNRFCKDMVAVLRNFNSNSKDEEKASIALNKICKHFGIELTNQKITSYVNGELVKITQLYSKSKNEMYYATMTKEKILIDNLEINSMHYVNINNVKSSNQ